MNILKTGCERLPYANVLLIWTKENKVQQFICPQRERSGQCCANIAVTTLDSDTGVDEPIKKLKSLHEKDSDQAAFLAYEDFEPFRRPTNMSTTDYKNESERRYNRMKAK